MRGDVVVEQVVFDFGGAVVPEARREGAPPACGRADAPASAEPRQAQRAVRSRSNRTSGTLEEGWTPERVFSYLAGLGLDPAGVVVGPDLLKALPFGGVRRVEWAEEHREACFPVRFLPRWRWEPYFVTVPFDGEGIGMLRPWVALVREPSGLRPYWLVRRYDEPQFVGLGKPVLPACFVIGPECLCAESRPIPAAARRAVEGASVLEEALEALRGRTVWLEMYAAGAVGHLVSRPFVLRDFRVEGRVPAGLGAGGGGRIRVEGDGGFGLELEAARDFRVFPGHIIIDSYVPGLGYRNSVSVWWGRA